MDPEHRKLISSNLKELAGAINIDAPMFKASLLDRQIFTNPMIEDIYEIKTETDRKRALLLELQTRGPNAFEKFITVLELSGEDSAVALLKPGLKKSSSNEAFVQDSKNENLHVRNLANINAEYGIRKLSVIPAKTWKEGLNIYKMTSEPRGFCLIINNVDFLDPKAQRVGSDLDAVRLDEVFLGLGYQVHVKKNLTADEMAKKLSAFKELFASSNVDSSVVIILSHGSKGSIYGVDAKYINLVDIFTMFDAYNCPYLKQKPKMFFFQACQGRIHDIGVPLYESTDAAVIADSEPKISLDTGIRLPTFSDMLISQSTIEGCVSMRTDSGSWYIQELVRALAELSYEMDLISILEYVDGRIQNKMSQQGVKQATEINTKGWHKKLYFNPGLKKPKD